MSICTFIAADIALDEIINPHYKTLSVNDALAIGVEINEELLSSEIDRNTPNVILWSDTELVLENGKVFDGDLDDDFALLTMADTLHYCDKAFGGYIEWHYYTEGRAKKIIKYIDGVLNKTDCVEIWNVWLSDYDPPKIRTISISIKDLQPIHIKQIAESNPWNNKSIINVFGPDTPIHCCLRITL